MKAENVTRVLLRVNTLVFLALVTSAFRLWRRPSSRVVTRGLLLAIAGSVAFQYVMTLVLDLGMLGSVRVDEYSNKVTTEFDVDRVTKDRIFRMKYNDPESFQDLVFVYDPTKVDFDSYSVNYVRRSRKFNSGRRTDKGEAFPEDKDLRMVSLPSAAGVARTYRQPSGSKNANFVSSINTQFFHGKGTKTEAEHAETLAKFQNIETQGKLMIKKNGKFEEVQRMNR